MLIQVGQRLPDSCSIATQCITVRSPDVPHCLSLPAVCKKSLANVCMLAEDMVIEYAGEMVRPTVADQREAASYNQLVGAGTYVFTLDDDLMVDATKAGNMAHLLNHSCQPNCYSKHVHVWDEALGVKVPHVVICSKQAIPIGEELTYDYRYAGVHKIHFV